VLITNLFKHWTHQIFAPGTVLREKYEVFKSVLTHDKKAHELMAELEEIYHNQTKVDIKLIEVKYNALSVNVSEILTAFSKMCPS
jgi:pyruvate,water dikinase